jgi:ABC-2 type transport system ATP-binding protein
LSAQTGKHLAALPERRSEAPVSAVPPVPRLAVRAVSKRWNADGPSVLDAVDFTLDAGKLVSLAGANGAGKTTLLRIVAGLISPDRGSVALDGLTIASDRREYQRRIGFVPAGQTGLYARLNVRNHLEYWARLAFVPRREQADVVDRALATFGLGPLAQQRADRLSTGQRQRLRLAMGFLHGPRLVLLDEPATSLDPDGLEVLRSALSSFLGAGGTAIWCAPTSEDVALPADGAYALADGSLEAT